MPRNEASVPNLNCGMNRFGRKLSHGTAASSLLVREPWADNASQSDIWAKAITGP